MPPTCSFDYFAYKSDCLWRLVDLDTSANKNKQFDSLPIHLTGKNAIKFLSFFFFFVLIPCTRFCTYSIITIIIIIVAVVVSSMEWDRMLANTRMAGRDFKLKIMIVWRSTSIKFRLATYPPTWRNGNIKTYDIRCRRQIT